MTSISPNILSPEASVSSNKSSKSIWDTINPLNILDRFNNYKSGLQLSNPGVYEELHREVKNVFPTNHLIDGGQFEFVKMLSQNVQMNHSFTLGSAQNPSAYNFIGVYADDNTLFQGSTDSDFNINGRIHYNFGKGFTTKGVIQTGPNVTQSMVQLEGDYFGIDNSINVKAINPSLSDNTGILVASYFQSLTKNLAVGSEVIFQRPSPEMEDSVFSYSAKYATPQSTFTAQLHDQGMLQASYFHKVSEVAEVGADLHIVAASGKRDAVCTLGAKFEFKQATMRTQLDTTGRVSTVLEERVAPPLTLLLSGDIDHFKGQSRFGLGVRFTI